jgi:hypothetical protein
MFPATSFRKEFEKIAMNADEARSIFLGIGKFVKKHPIITGAAVAAPLLGIGLLRNAAVPLTIYNEQRKKGIMLEQEKILQNISDQLQRNGQSIQPQPAAPMYKKEPLA